MHVDDLLNCVAEIQEAVKRLHNIKGGEREINRLFNSYVPVGQNIEKEARWSLLLHKSRSPLWSPTSIFTTKNRYKTLAAIGMPNTKDLHLQEEITLAACSGYHKKKGCMLIAGHSLLIV